MITLFREVGDFQDAIPNIKNPADISNEHVFVKQVGEKNLADQEIIGKLGGKDPVAVHNIQVSSQAKPGAKAMARQQPSILPHP